MKEDSLSLSHRLRRLINMGLDKAPEEEIIAGIEEGVSFQGAKLWILVLAIFVASLGLNTNSTAVIIGAMLISPLMGPIIGMGLGVGVYDFSLLKRAFRNYLVATAFSVVTATVYFLITPIDEAQSELLARTSPTIYDVAIAICGGLAGIIALSSRSQRTGNVIPGVAIATALMPPLCTVGFGIATGNWFYAAGALYLYLINTIFIALSTFVGVAFIMRFRKQTMINKRREKQVHRYITTIALLTIVPSLFITFHIVQQTIYEERVQQFIHEALVFDNTQVIDHSIDLSEHSIRVMLFGEEVDSAQIEEARRLLPAGRTGKRQYQKRGAAVAHHEAEPREGEKRRAAFHRREQDAQGGAEAGSLSGAGSPGAYHPARASTALPAGRSVEYVEGCDCEPDGFCTFGSKGAHSRRPDSQAYAKGQRQAHARLASSAHSISRTAHCRDKRERGEE